MYKLENLKIGMITSDKQLSCIYDRLVILNVIRDEDDETFGEIMYIGEDDEVPDNIEEIVKKCREVMPIYNNSEDLYVVYDE